jgi:hypothetical protein
VKATTSTVAVLAAALTLSTTAAQAAPAARNCPGGYLCVYDGPNLTGDQLIVRRCGFTDLGAAWSDRIRSYDNNQTPGTPATFMKRTASGWVPVYRSVARDIKNDAPEAVRTSDGILLC